jgi:hypothetical protein
MGDIPPCATVYVNNLNEKIKKDGASKGNHGAVSSRESPRLTSVASFRFVCPDRTLGNSVAIDLYDPTRW